MLKNIEIRKYDPKTGGAELVELKDGVYINKKGNLAVFKDGTFAATDEVPPAVLSLTPIDLQMTMIDALLDAEYLGEL